MSSESVKLFVWSYVTFYSDDSVTLVFSRHQHTSHHTIIASTFICMNLLRVSSAAKKLQGVVKYLLGVRKLSERKDAD